MLLDFTVENFRSIKGAETLSAVAASKSKVKSNSESHRRIKSDDEIAQPFHIEGWDIDVLPVIAIFGANASGKSNVLKAFDYLLEFICNGDHNHHSQPIPFKLDKQSLENPSSFRIRVAVDGTIYTYSISLNRNRILSEKLEYALVYTKRERLLFNRNWNIKKQKFEWKNGSDFAGAHTQLQKGLRESEPFISLFSKLEIKVVKPLVDWLNYSLVGAYCGHRHMDNFILDLLWSNLLLPSQQFDETSKILENVKNLLLKFDTGLYNIEVRAEGKDDNRYQIYASHKTEDSKIISWKFEEESAGTQNLFGLACRIEVMLEKSSLVTSDELGANLHPNIVHEIVRIFQNSKTNPNRTQLIFTSHDNTLQRNNLLRRDQIWFTQKRPDQSTELYPLSDFKVRNDLAIDKAYLDGRFGAVPFISDEDEEPISLKEKDKDNG